MCEQLYYMRDFGSLLVYSIQVSFNTMVTSQTLQASVSMLNVTFWEMQLESSIEGGKSLSTLKKNMPAQLRFAILYLKKPQDFWNNASWSGPK